MRSILIDALDDRVTIGRRTYRIRPTVARVVLAMEALKDDQMLETSRLKLAVYWLFRWPRPKPTATAVNAALDLLMEESPYGKDPKSKQALEQTQDAAMIVAAFRQQYGIDLNREAARMDWRTYTALLGGITDGTTLGEIMHIRTMEMPKWTAYNGDQRREIQRMKMIYAIKNPNVRKQSFEDGLRGMVEVLVSMCDEEEQKRENA